VLLNPVDLDRGFFNIGFNGLLLGVFDLTANGFL